MGIYRGIEMPSNSGNCSSHCLNFVSKCSGKGSSHCIGIVSPVLGSIVVILKVSCKRLRAMTTNGLRTPIKSNPGLAAAEAN